MKDTIYREDAINSIYKLKKTVIKHDVLSYRDGLSDTLEIVQDLPSANRPQGEWIDIGTISHSYKCSVCKCPRRDNRVGHTKFCNACGARMKGADDETDRC